MSASVGDGGLSYTVIEEGVKTWVGTTPVTTALLWVVAPPLLLWVVWLIVRQRPDSRVPSVAGGASGALPEGSAPAEDWRVRRDDRAPAERGRVTTPNP